MQTLSLLLQDAGYIKLLKLDLIAKTIQEQAKTSQAFDGIRDVMKFGEYFLAITKVHPHKQDSSGEQGALLVFNQQLELIEVKAFGWVEAFANWREEKLLLCAEQCLYCLNDKFNIQSKHDLSESVYGANIQQMTLINDISTGFILETNHSGNYLHQIIDDNGQLMVWEIDHIEDLIDGAMNAHVIDQDNKQWHILGTSYKSRNYLHLCSSLLLSYPLNDYWEGQYKEREEKLLGTKVFDVDYNIEYNGKQPSIETFKIGDIITNRLDCANHKNLSIDILATTATNPCWGIVRINAENYIARINFEKAQVFTIFNFLVLETFGRLSFQKSKITKVGDTLVISYIDEFAHNENYTLKVFDIKNSQQPKEIFSLQPKNGKTKAPQFYDKYATPCFVVF